MQGFDKEKITNAMAKMMENLFCGKNSKDMSKRWQPSRLSKMTRLKRKKVTVMLGTVEAAAAVEGTQPLLLRTVCNRDQLYRRRAS